MKDKEWLKGLINEEGIAMDMHLLGRLDEQYWKNENIKINKGRLFYLIDQLGEPEKPVIPQFIANWIESYRKKTLVELINDAVYSSDEDSQCFRRWFHEEMGFESNYDEFLSRVWLDGYTTEKEKLYRVRVGKSYVRFNLDGSIIGAKAVNSVVTLDHLSKLPFDYKKAVESGIITLVEVTE